MPASSNLKSILKYLAAGGVGEAVAPGSGVAAGAATAGMDAATAGVSKLDTAIQILTARFAEFETKAQAVGNVLGAKGWFDSLTDSAHKIDALGADLQRATGQAESLSAAIGGSGLGISMQEAGTQVASLHNNYADFSELSADVMKSVTKQAQGFTRLGVSIEDFGKTAEHMTKGWGLSVKQMEKTQNKIHKAALSLGVAPAKMAKDLAASIPRLMHWGKAGTEVFLRLAAQSKATGVEMGTLLGVAEGFDDFEQAAGKVGKLNMLLGGPYLNSVQMLKADEEERIQILKDSIALTGKSVDQLGRWRVKDIAKTMGFNNLADFYKSMGAPQSVIDKYKKKLTPAELAQQNLNKAIGKGVKLAEVWSAWFENISTILGKEFLPVMRQVGKFVMSGEGMKGVTQVFDSFASGIKHALTMWKDMDPLVKKQIKSFGLFFLKMTATSHAVKGFRSVLSPLIQMFTNPASGLIAITTWLITNWGVDLKATIGNLKKSFNSLHETVGGWITSIENRFPKVGGALRKLHKFIQSTLTTAMDTAKDFKWQDKIVEFIDSITEGYKTLSKFFGFLTKGASESGNTMTTVIGNIGKSLKTVIGGVINDLEAMILNRFGPMINQYITDKGRGVPDWLMSETQENQYYGGQMVTNLNNLGATGITSMVGQYLGLLQQEASVDKLASSDLGTFLKDKKIIPKEMMHDPSNWDLSNMSDLIKGLAAKKVASKNTGGHVKPKELTSFGQEEGLIYAPNGSAMVLAASQMGAFGGGSGGGGGPINLYVDGEKLASSLPLINALNSEIQTRRG